MKYLKVTLPSTRGKFYLGVVRGRLLRRMFATAWRAEEYAAAVSTRYNHLKQDRAQRQPMID